MPFPTFFAASMIAYLLVSILMFGFIKKYLKLRKKNFYGYEIIYQQ